MAPAATLELTLQASGDTLTGTLRRTLGPAPDATETGEVVVSIRDDGVGFDYDEETLRREGRLGVLRSMKGRIEELGGSMSVHSAPGRGTEIEFHLPVAEGVQR